MTSEDVMEIAARVIAPYAIDVQDVAWFSIYEVAQRLTDTFDDAHERDGLRGCSSPATPAIPTAPRPVRA
jgi:phenol 2-monooxygenase (NADPH)